MRGQISHGIAYQESALRQMKLAAACKHADPCTQQDQVLLLHNLVSTLLASDEPEHVADAIARSSEALRLFGETVACSDAGTDESTADSADDSEILDGLIELRAIALERAGQQ